MRLLLNVVQSQVAWFACVLSAAAGRAWIGVCVAAALIAAHVARADNPRDMKRRLCSPPPSSAPASILSSYNSMCCVFQEPTDQP